MDLQQWFREPQSRRHMLRHLGLFAGATVAKTHYYANITHY